MTSPAAIWIELRLAEEPVQMLENPGYTYAPKESLMHVLATGEVRGVSARL